MGSTGQAQLRGETEALAVVPPQSDQVTRGPKTPDLISRDLSPLHVRKRSLSLTGEESSPIISTSPLETNLRRFPPRPSAQAACTIFRILDLPPEIRRMIYVLVVSRQYRSHAKCGHKLKFIPRRAWLRESDDAVKERYREWRPVTGKSELALAAVCRQLYQESSPVYYQENAFLFDLEGKYIPGGRPEAHSSISHFWESYKAALGENRKNVVHALLTTKRIVDVEGLPDVLEGVRILGFHADPVRTRWSGVKGRSEFVRNLRCPFPMLFERCSALQVLKLVEQNVSMTLATRDMPNCIDISDGKWEHDIWYPACRACSFRSIRRRA